MRVQPRSLVDPIPIGVSSRFIRFALILASISLVAACLLIWPQHGRVLDWDEVDYVSAARLGVVDNVLEVGSLSIRDYIRFARAKLDKAPVSLPAGYSERSDPLLLRHYHPPAIPAAIAALSASRGERAPRAVQLVGAAALMAAVVCAYLLTSPKPSYYGLVPVVLGLAWVSWHLYGVLQFHGWEAVWISVLGISLLQWVRTGHQRAWAVAICASLAIAILTLEAGVLLLAPTAICVVASARARGIRSPWTWIRRYLLPGLILVVGAVVVAWPGAILRGSVIKTPLTFAYLIIRKETFASTSGGTGSLVVIVPGLLVLAAVAFLFLTKRDELSRWGPWAVLGIVYGVPLLPFALGPRFVLPAIAALFVLVGYAVDVAPGGLKAPVAGLLIVLVAAGMIAEIRANGSATKTDRAWRADLAFLDTKLAGTSSILDGGHIYRHYLKDRDIDDLWLSFDQASLLRRRNGEYQTLTDSDVAGKYIGVLRRRTTFPGHPASTQLARQCQLLVRPTLWLWDCTQRPPP